MPNILDDETRNELQQVLRNLDNHVKLLFFTQKSGCPACPQQLELLEELASISDKLELEIYDFVLHGDEAVSYRIDKIPAIAVIGKRDYGIRFYGLTAGYEFDSLLEAITMVSNGRSGLSPQLEELVKKIDEQVNLQVLVTLTCPYCPKMVHIAHQFAFVNPNIRADMVDASQFPYLVQKYNLTGVPKTIINETYSFDGALSEERVYLEILKAVKPEEYKHLNEAIQETQGTHKTKVADENHEYEVIIVGGGPPAITAAIYSTRKGLDTVLITKTIGGQITYTASIDNYPGLPGVSGKEMAKMFSNHLENYPVAESLGADVVQVRKEEDRFVVSTEDNRKYRARSIIYCAGKEYRKLGVPGEESFIGKGIGFCATCDAPLYQNKNVAVVGGGNSAFTSVRDLLSFASEIHLIHHKTEFTADPELVQWVLGAKNVTLHTPMIVSEFLGIDKLTGARLISPDGKDKLDLEVDAVFLEIGLTANTVPLKGLIELDESGEVPTDRFQSTSLKGLFAAGDVTDTKEKQISIAVGQGALAALSVHKYLIENGLTKSRTGLRESWQ